MLHPDVQRLMDHLAEEVQIFAAYNAKDLGVCVRSPAPKTEDQILEKSPK